MPVSPDRVKGLMQWKHEVVGGFHKTVDLEKQSNAVGLSSYRPGTLKLEWSIRLDPSPIVRLITEEDIAESGNNVSLGDYAFEIVGGQVSEQKLRESNRIILNKGESDEEQMQILQIRPAGWLDDRTTVNELAIVGGEVILWKVFARATKLAA